MNWTDERVERLTKLWAEGLSASQIAAQLGGVSRNAVIGKVHRLCLPGRAKAGGSSSASRAPKRPAPTTARPQSFQPRVATRSAARPAGTTVSHDEIDAGGEEERAVVPVPSNVVVPISRRLALTELTDRTCKWPIGDPMTDEFHFCGCEASDNAPYCTYHSKLAYQPVNDRRRSSAQKQSLPSR